MNCLQSTDKSVIESVPQSIVRLNFSRGCVAFPLLDASLSYLQNNASTFQRKIIVFCGEGVLKTQRTPLEARIYFSRFNNTPWNFPTIKLNRIPYRQDPIFPSLNPQNLSNF